MFHDTNVLIVCRRIATADSISSSVTFKGGRKREERIGVLLREMVELGIARADTDRAGRFFLPE